MTVEFFFCEDIEYTAEQKAFYKLAKSLHKKYKDSANYFALIANVTNNPADLPQLDAILIGENFTALIDFKNCGDPLILPQVETAMWYAQPLHGRKYPVRGGKRNNPRIQARKTHYAWSNYLKEQSALILGKSNLKWNQLKGWVLFEPRLHPDNVISLTEKDHLWLSFSDISHLDTLLSGAKTDLKLTQSEIKTLVQHIFKAQARNEFDRNFTKMLGYIEIVGRGETYDIYSFDTLTVGRSRDCDIKIPAYYKYVSGHHARVETGLASVKIFDDDSTHGTYVDGTTIDSTTGNRLTHHTEIILGKTIPPDACKLKYTSRNTNEDDSRTQFTEL